MNFNIFGWLRLDFFFFLRSTFGTYILSLGGNRQNERNRVKDIFLPVFSALVDALVLRAQVTSWKLYQVQFLFQFYISLSYHIQLQHTAIPWILLPIYIVLIVKIGKLLRFWWIFFWIVSVHILEILRLVIHSFLHLSFAFFTYCISTMLDF